MKNYYDFRKTVKQKLNRILEEKIERLVLPQNAFGYTAKKGHYVVTPFGVSQYIISVVLPDLDTYNDFYNAYYDGDDEIFSEINWKRDGVYGQFGADMYINEARLEDAQALVKEIFERIADED